MDDTGLLPRETRFPSESEEARNERNRTLGGSMRDEAAGTPRNVIYISHEASENVGMDWFARWLRPYVPEVSVRYISTTDEFWTL